jgi:ABC-type dipeptide/oligopeptide/nickel transport system permease subunit
VLPTFTLALAAIAGYSRYQRNAMLDVLGQDFIRTARAKGLTRRRALFKHGLRTALIPMATLFAYSVAGLFTGAVFTEKIFGWHGMGEWFVQGLNTQDTNIIAAPLLFRIARLLFIVLRAAAAAVLLRLDYTPALAARRRPYSSGTNALGQDLLAQTLRHAEVDADRGLRGINLDNRRGDGGINRRLLRRRA